MSGADNRVGPRFGHALSLPEIRKAVLQRVVTTGKRRTKRFGSQFNRTAGIYGFTNRLHPRFEEENDTVIARLYLDIGSLPEIMNENMGGAYDGHRTGKRFQEFWGRQGH
jgi:hypothetical protein